MTLPESISIDDGGQMLLMPIDAPHVDDKEIFDAFAL